MVTHREFMSVGLNKCGSDRDTFSRLNDLWNREKEAISAMSKRELRQKLECP